MWSRRMYRHMDRVAQLDCALLVTSASNGDSAAGGSGRQATQRGWEASDGWRR
jgi:hypothetical protein